MSNCNLDAASCALFRGLIVNLLNPAMLLLTGVAALYFLYGMVVFLVKMSNGEDPKEGKQHMIWGIIGLLIMVAAYAIIVFIQNTVVGLGGH